MFVSEVVELGIFKDLFFALRYKLHIFVFRLEGHAYVLCDNFGVVKNMSIPVSVF